MEDRTRLFRETLRHKLADPFLVRRYEGLYYDFPVKAPMTKAAAAAAAAAATTTMTTSGGLKGNDQENNEAPSNVKGGRTRLRLDTNEALKLTCFPWRLNRQQIDTGGDNRSNNDGGGDERTKTAVECGENKKREAQEEDEAPSCLFMCESHLELRHMQNTRWADGRLTKGVEYAKLALQVSSTEYTSLVPSSSCTNLALAKKAETCYREGLDMIPNHAGLCVAYGALCANDGRLELAKSMFIKALPTHSSPQYFNNDAAQDKDKGDTCVNETSYTSVEVPTATATATTTTVASSTVNTQHKLKQETVVHKNARLYLAAVEKRMEKEKLMPSSSLRHNHNHTNNNNNIKSGSMPVMSNRAEKALQDAITERDFLMGPPPPLHVISSSAHTSAGGASTASATIAGAMTSSEGTHLGHNHHRSNGYRGIVQKTYDLLEEPQTSKDEDGDHDGDDNIDDDDRRRRKRRKSARRHGRTKRRRSSYDRKGRRRRSEKYEKYDNEDGGDGSDNDSDESGCDRQRRRRRRKHKSSDRTANRCRSRQRRQSKSERKYARSSSSNRSSSSSKSSS